MIWIVAIVVVSWLSGLAFGASRWWHEHGEEPPDDWELWKGEGVPPVGASRITLPRHPELSDRGWMVRR